MREPSLNRPVADLDPSGRRMRWELFRVLLCVLLCLPVPLIATAPGLAAPANASTDSFSEKVLEVIRRNPAAIVEALERYEEAKEKEQNEKQAALIRQLFPVPQQIIGESPVLGNQGDSLLVEFSDFQCPYCAQAQQTLKPLLKKEGKGLKLVYKHFPLSQIHPQALPAARAAWAAGRQGKFWEFHDALFSNQSKLGEEFYQETAKSLGLNLARFSGDRKGEESLRAIQEDLALAERIGLRGTPTFLLQRGGSFEVISLQELQEGVPRQARTP